LETVKISRVIPNEDNPRYIKEDKFKKLVQSLKDFPEMANARPIVVNKEMVALGGNMRLKAMQEAGWSEVPVEIVDWSEEKQREFIIKDNVGFGDWDWDELANTWNSVELEDWGIDSWQNMDDIDTTDEFTLPSGDKEPFQQMTFTLADEQAEQIKNAIADIKQTEEYKYVETMGNENSNGNALYLIALCNGQSKGNNC
jgi:hypothetical protein